MAAGCHIEESKKIAGLANGIGGIAEMFSVSLAVTASALACGLDSRFLAKAAHG
ncbi:MAG: hypothetical protein ACREOR_01565 [Candidatus Binatia bacterium]